MSATEKYVFDRTSQEMLERLAVPFAVYQFVDKRVVTLVLSDGFCKLFGYDDRAQAYFDMDHDMYKDTHPNDVARIANAAIRFAMEGGTYEVVYRTRVRGSSDYRIVHAYGEHVYEETGVRLAHVWYSDEGVYTEGNDEQVTKLTRALSNAIHEESIVNASRYDYLTGLPSMTYFFELAEIGRHRIRERGGNPVLLYTDFNGMKFYNAQHGFSEGDRLLRAYAKALSRVFGNENSCRVGADQFVVIAEEEGLDKKLGALTNECQTINGRKTLPVHIGVYVVQDETAHTSVACDRAKLACNALRGRYETAVSYYSSSLSEGTNRERYVVENLDRALSEGWVRVYLQPIIRAVNGLVCDVEALARWIDPERGLIPPDSFIPELEDAGLIHKLDLYMVEQVLESMKTQAAEDFCVVPHSINLSRCDFDACDMVEEVRRRVDEAGIRRDLVTIELTESVIGSDFEFMKTQVERFRELGFPVWMDDFGSGYSSLDILQSTQFDLLKFDRSFMQGFYEGKNAKTLITELMRMATSLGVETVCEGVETAEQASFLLEIGCSKLQGFYYSKPVPFETILEKRKQRTLIENEDPRDAEYFESVGRVNLYDLGIIADSDERALDYVFSSLPMAILEVEGDNARYVRSNQSYRDFVERFFGIALAEDPTGLAGRNVLYGPTFKSVARRCCATGTRAFFDERMPDGSVVHAFVRRISTSSVTGRTAIVIAILSITEADESTTYADIASSLATDYYNIYIIDLDTDEFFEYTSQVGEEYMSLKQRGMDFFASARHEAMTRIYEKDIEPFLSLFTKKNVVEDVERQGVFTTTYRLMDTGAPTYVNMKVTRMKGGNRLILGVSIVDQHVRQLEEARRLREEKVSLGRIAALSPDYLVLYTIDPETGRYTQYNPSNEYREYGLSTQGRDFFLDVVRDSPKAIAPEDLERHLRALTKERLLSKIREGSSFTHHYHMLMGGRRIPVTLRAAMVKEEDGEKIILGITSDEQGHRRH